MSGLFILEKKKIRGTFPIEGSFFVGGGAVGGSKKRFPIHPLSPTDYWIRSSVLPLTHSFIILVRLHVSWPRPWLIIHQLWSEQNWTSRLAYLRGRKPNQILFPRFSGIYLNSFWIRRFLQRRVPLSYSKCYQL